MEILSLIRNYVSFVLDDSAMNMRKDILRVAEIIKNKELLNVIK